MHTGLKARTRIALCQRPGADLAEEAGRYDLAWKDLCSVLNALSKYEMNYQRYSNIFYVHGYL